MLTKIKTFVKKEVVLCISALCAVITMFFVPPDMQYIEYIDFRVLCLLLCLMAVVAGFKSVGVFETLTYQLLCRIRSGRTLSVTLVMLPFFSSMFVTNDVALIVFIPFTIALLLQLGLNKSVVPVIVLQTVAANLGSMATPVGNPQNLYLYSTYNLTVGEFFFVTLPLTAVSFAMLIVACLPVLKKKFSAEAPKKETISNKIKLIIYALLFILCLFTVFKVVPYQVTTVIIIAVFLVTDIKQLKEIDFMLLATFVCFFIISENLGRIDGVRAFLQTLLSADTLITSVGTSQVISNVPAAVLLSGFTDDWKELLAGVNIGGLGTPVASLASLITLKLYLKSDGAKIFKFLAVFTVANVVGLAILLTFVELV